MTQPTTPIPYSPRHRPEPGTVTEEIPKYTGSPNQHTSPDKKGFMRTVGRVPAWVWVVTALVATALVVAGVWLVKLEHNLKEAESTYNTEKSMLESYVEYSENTYNRLKNYASKTTVEDLKDSIEDAKTLLTSPGIPQGFSERRLTLLKLATSEMDTEIHELLTLTDRVKKSAQENLAKDPSLVESDKEAGSSEQLTENQQARERLQATLDKAKMMLDQSELYQNTKQGLSSAWQVLKSTVQQVADALGKSELSTSVMNALNTLLEKAMSAVSE